MPKLTAVATATPPHMVEQSTARDFAQQLFGRHFDNIDRLLPLFENAGIERRHFVVPPEWFEEPHSLEEKNELYIESATDLGERAARKLMTENNLEPADIDYIIYINTTGLATPSIDARLINRLGLERDIRRTPIWGLGCAGGAAGLSHAFHYLVGHPNHRVLVIAAELCGLTFMPDDFSKSNLVATALFGDGAAAALVVGDGIRSDGLSLLTTQSNFYPDSLDVMGWNVQTRGMQVIFDRRIPEIVAENSLAELEVLLSQNRLTRDNIDYYLYHPGGMKVLEAYQQAYGATDEAFRYPREILRDYGNMSSVTVLYVIERYLSHNSQDGSGYGVISALGPGFSSESLLVRL